MRHRVDHRTLGRYGSHRRAMLANMAASLFLNGQIQTTVTRAKELRRVAEKLITRARGGSVHDIRLTRRPRRSCFRNWPPAMPLSTRAGTRASSSWGTARATARRWP